MVQIPGLLMVLPNIWVIFDKFIDHHEMFIEVGSKKFRGDLRYVGLHVNKTLTTSGPIVNYFHILPKKHTHTTVNDS